MNTMDDWNAATPVTAPIPPKLYPLLAYIFLSFGILSGATFIVQGKNTSLVKQFQASLLASLFLGFGTIFTSLSVGIYV